MSDLDKSEIDTNSLIPALKESSQFSLIDGKTELIHSFGDMIGQVEIDSKEFKSLKGDYYVMSAGECILRSMSNTNHKTALKAVSSIGEEIKFNSKVTMLTPDLCPIIGKSNKYGNMVYNFGANSKMFQNQ